MATITMTATETTTQQPTIVWDRATILKDGIAFLDAKEKHLISLKHLWDSSWSSGIPGRSFYDEPSKIAAKRYESFAEQSFNEVTALEKAIEIETLSNNNSGDKKQNKLFKIAILTNIGLNYFREVTTRTFSPEDSYLLPGNIRQFTALAICTLASILAGESLLGGTSDTSLFYAKLGARITVEIGLGLGLSTYLKKMSFDKFENDINISQEDFRKRIDDELKRNGQR